MAIRYFRLGNRVPENVIFVFPAKSQHQQYCVKRCLLGDMIKCGAVIRGNPLNCLDLLQSPSFTPAILMYDLNTLQIVSKPG